MPGSFLVIEDTTKYERMKEGVLIYDGDGEILYANPAALRMLGLASLEDLKNFDGWSLIPPEYTEIVRRRIESALSGKINPPLVLRIVTADRRIERIKSEAFPVIYRGRRCVMAVITYDEADKFSRKALRDVFEITSRIVQPVLEKRKVDLDELCSLLLKELENIVPGVEMVCHARGEPCYTSFEDDECLLKEKCVLKEAMDKGEEIYISRDDLDVPRTFFALPLSVEEDMGGLCFRREGYGSFYPEDLSVFRMVRDIISAALKLENVVLELETQKSRYFTMAMNDPLTGAKTRNFLNEIFQKIIPLMLREGREIALVMMDIDDLKRVNDEHGHTEGDKLLRDFASIVMGCIRDMDFLVRLGGDEFLLVLPGASEAEARKVVERILGKIGEVNKNRSIPISFSYGVSTIGKSRDFETALEEADLRMYSMKSEKKSA